MMHWGASNVTSGVRTVCKSEVCRSQAQQNQIGISRLFMARRQNRILETERAEAYDSQSSFY